MRLRLFLSFLLLILITTLSVTFLARWQMNVALQRFTSRGGFAGAEALVTSLENYYTTYHSWDGVNVLFQTHKPGGQGQGNQNNGDGPGYPQGPDDTFLLTDNSNQIIVDTSQANFYPAPAREITDDEKDRAIAIRVNREIVACLIPAERP
ncbi:MAG TPA: hypothetical protein PK530_23215, partial [Anaerolineales bacterium]|nr:hypothetical protein [Anaerolineales bacterium]